MLHAPGKPGKRGAHVLAAEITRGGDTGAGTGGPQAPGRRSLSGLGLTGRDAPKGSGDGTRRKAVTRGRVHRGRLADPTAVSPLSPPTLEGDGDPDPPHRDRATRRSGTQPRDPAPPQWPPPSVPLGVRARGGRGVEVPREGTFRDGEKGGHLGEK